MKLLFYEYITPGWMHLKPVAEEARRRGHEVTVLTHIYDEPIVKRMLPNLKISVTLPEYIKRDGFKVAVCKTAGPKYWETLKKINPDYIFIAEERRIGFTQGYKALQIYHAMVRGKFGYPIEQDKMAYKFFLAGNVQKKYLASLLPNRIKDIHVVGFPKFDSLPKRPPKRDPQYTVLYAPTWDEGNTNIDIIGRRIPELAKEYHVIVKLHDHIITKRDKDWDNFYSSAPVEYVKDFSILASILKCDIMVSDMSSCILEALVLGKPVVVLRQRGSKVSPNLPRVEIEPLLYHVRTFEQMKNLLSKQPKQRPYTNRTIRGFYRKGKASARILDIVEKDFKS